MQTKKRLQENILRVSLQLSSNPENLTNLSYLDIMLDVPSIVIGETVITSPKGGTWNSEKRTISWRISELDIGAKTQLHARFELYRAIAKAEELSFPVTVRYQGLYSQLSDLNVRVSDAGGERPVDVSMKLARRFRVTHREND